ncbi:SUMF1/EgtB/PvdO family nonheme iron enzyme [Methylomonas koyamae]|uniref:SUMF1/EgtB/PvdO family nonheme iron enzyme n=1 Tax=Methylomonas koyamae TaxID=702114 RepID=UPI002110462B|nr:SUMF1/EgtB/PvdO family nonheme iron enzyme [Methylomonas koyamae]
MVAIPGGVYLMGSPVTDQEGQDYEKPRHEVKVSGFAIGKYEISKSQFAAFVEAANYNPGNECWTMEAGKGEMRSNRNWSAPGYPQDSDHPATCVSVDDAEAYIKWLNQKTGKHYRLPTEAEWEYAARGGSAAARFWGDNPDGACKYANVADLSLQKADSKVIPHNCEDGYVFTAPVAVTRLTRLGFTTCWEMSGNGPAVRIADTVPAKRKNVPACYRGASTAAVRGSIPRTMSVPPLATAIFRHFGSITWDFAWRAIIELYPGWPGI